MNKSVTGNVGDENLLAVHSVNKFVFSVPDLAIAKKFYESFGLDVREHNGCIDLYTFGHPHCWGSVYESGDRKKLQYVSYGIYAEDETAFKEKIEQLGIGIKGHDFGGNNGIWFLNPDGVATQLLVATKVSPSEKTKLVPADLPELGKGAAPSCSKVHVVQPRYLSHILLFTPDVVRMTEFFNKVLGLRVADYSADIIAFNYSPHGSDHHLVALAKSNGPGLHHTSWDVGSVNDIGVGSEQMRNAGWDKGWGVGRHVLGSNYFYYVEDPWGSFAEYSCDIDFVPAGFDWPAANHAPEDSLYVWGPQLPANFIANTEIA
jgi:catechol 2,3-dioxygenase-like lactoylglutathione lyase family enzyme